MATNRFSGRVTPYLIDHRKVARLCGVSTAAMRHWVAVGLWPPPHSAFGRTRLYRVADVKHYLDTGRWPGPAFTIAAGRGGTKGLDFRAQAEGDGSGGPGRGQDVRQNLVDHKAFAALCGITPQALRRRAGRGYWPLPHSYAGRVWLYRVDLVGHYLREGRWPPWARFAHGVGIGRYHTDPDPPPPVELYGPRGSAGADPLPGLVTHREAARRCGAAAREVRPWVYQGVWPRPPALLDRVWFYRAADVDHFLGTGCWPAGMTYHGAGRCGPYASAADTPAPPLGPAACARPERVPPGAAAGAAAADGEAGHHTEKAPPAEARVAPRRPPARPGKAPAARGPRPNSFDLKALRKKLGLV